MEQQQADALARVAEAALHHGINPGAPGERYQVVVTSMPRCWPMRTHRASRCWKAARAFPPERPSVWRVTPAAW